MKLPIYSKHYFFMHYTYAHHLIFSPLIYCGFGKYNKIQEFPRCSYTEIPTVKTDKYYKNRKITDASRVPNFPVTAILRHLLKVEVIVTKLAIRKSGIPV